MKKVLITIVGFFLLASSLSIHAYADAPMVITMNDTAVTADETADMDIVISGNPGFTYLKLGLTYDSDKLEVTVSNGSLIDSLTKGKFYVWSCDEDADENGILCTLHIKVKPGTEPGQYRIELKCFECSNYDEEDVPFICQSGTVEVKPAGCRHVLEQIAQVNPTCTQKGRAAYYTCSVCHMTFSDPDGMTEVTDLSTLDIPAKGHTEVTVKGKAATCTETGLTDGKKCSVCNTVLVAQTEVPMVDHAPGEWIVDKEAGIGTVGHRHKECTVCHTVLEESDIEALTEAETPVEEPTDTTAGRPTDTEPAPTSETEPETAKETATETDTESEWSSETDPSPVTDPETERTTDPETDGTTDRPEDKGGCFGVLGSEGMLLVLMMVLAVIGFKKEKNSQIP